MSPPTWAFDFAHTLESSFSPVLHHFSGLSATTGVAYLVLFTLTLWGVSLFNKYRLMRLENSHHPSRVAEQAARSQDPMLAGELFEQAQAYPQAIDAYKSARAFQDVGRVYEQMKQWDDAAQFYSLCGDSEKSALMYQRGGDYIHAAEAYLACNKNLLAAEMYEKGSEFEKAAGQYEKFGKQLKAAELYQRSENYERAAEKYEAFYLKQKVLTTNQSPEKVKQVKQAAFEAGSLYLRMKRFGKAMEVYSDAGFFEQAAESATQLGEIEQAAQFYLSARLFEKAAKIYEAMGDEKQGHWIMAKKHHEEGNFSSAAEAYQHGENWTEAAEMYEKAGNKASAAQMYEQAGDYHRAADLFLSLENLSAAARCLERSGRLQEAADLYLQRKEYDRAAQMQELLGEYYAAALLFKEADDTDRCISYLQKVPPDASDYYAATLLQSQLLTDRGLFPAAVECLKKIVSKKKVNADTIEIYYQLATLYERQKSFEEAEVLYDRILDKDFNYKDARQRCDLLKKALQEVKEALEQRALNEEQSLSPVATPEQNERYKIVRKIGQGGMGVVYLAEDSILKRVVAYKVLPQSIRDNQTALKNFLQEAQIAAALNHPNIVTIFDTGTNKDDVFITMEYIDGISLKRYLERYRSSIKERVDIMKAICLGVAYAHQRNVIHRDLKPSNVMLLKDRSVKIMDFGLAKFITESMAEKTSIKGTPLYMSPEQIVGEQVGTLSDIYSLGCTFYRMLTGRPPYSKGDIYYQHLHTQATPPQMLNADISPELSEIVMKCIEKKKELRFASAGELVEALTQLSEAPSLKL